MKRINVIITVIVFVVLIGVVCSVEKITRMRQSRDVELAEEAVSKDTSIKEGVIKQKLNLVWKYHNRGNNQSAIQAAEDYLRLAPQDKEVWAVLVENYIWADNLTEAERAANELLKLDPKFAWGLRLLAAVFRTQANQFPQLKQEYLSKAKLQIEEALDTHPDNEFIILEAAKIYLAMGKKNEALRAINKALEQRPENKNYLNLREEILSGSK